MTKKDYELAIFNQLFFGKDPEYDEYKKMSDFELSLKLKITVSKIKGLKNESQLRYQNNTVYTIKEKCSQLLGTLEYTKEDKNRVSFCVPDPMIQAYIKDYMNRNGKRMDSSFSNDIVVLSADAFCDFLDNNCTQNQKNTIMNQLPPNNKKLGFRKFIKEVLQCVDGAFSIASACQHFIGK